ncbi:hypothetical protein [Actinomadura fibrosa]|uniref:Ferric oxidoreductase domain-containing protein n=1 Tax=Actinomadura fibrosa TaxID=111802 RepID=A0ABW2XRH2_9ACTN|nr:hypothetical protein [Actinomadura fibrosa]
MRTRNSDDPAVPTWALRAVLAGAVLVLIGAATPPGAAMAANVQYFLSFYAGVFTLLALTTAVVSGLLATERLILGIRHRVMAQGVHRASAVLAVAMVIAHIAVKELGGLALPKQIVVPGLDPVGLGTLAFELMMLVVLTGLLRVRFAFRWKPWVWRTMHSLAYVSWPIGIMHGLTAGRTAANWVTLSYVMSVAGVALALLTRMIVVVKPRNVRRAGEEFGAPVGERAAASARTRGGRKAVRVPDQQVMVGDRRVAADDPRDMPDDPRALLDDPRLMADDPRLMADDPRGMPENSRATVADPRGMPVRRAGYGDTEVIR